MYWNVIVHAHLFGMFRQAKHLRFVIYTLRPRYVSYVVMLKSCGILDMLRSFFFTVYIYICILEDCILYSLRAKRDPF